MWLFVGLGNPGKQYQHHRHNVGFMVIETLSGHQADFASSAKSKFHGVIAEGRLAGEKIALLMPQTFMNLSGQSVGEAARFYKIDPARIIVFHDELDLPPGEIRVKQGGGNAGHNGLKSIEAHLGTPDFWRVRIGIGHPGDKNRVSDYVLHDFSKEDELWLGPALTAMAAQAGLIVSEGPKAFEKQLQTLLKKEK